jgi:hypothetical protein
MAKTFPYGLKAYYEGEKSRIQREKEGLQKILELLDLEQQERVDRAEMQIANEEHLQETILAIRKAYHEKRLTAIKEYGQKEVAEVQAQLEAQAITMNEYFLSMKGTKNFQKSLEQALAFNRLPDDAKLQLNAVGLEMDMKQVQKVRVKNAPDFLRTVEKELSKELRAYREPLEDFARFGQRIGESIAQGITEGVPGLKNAFKAVLATTLDFLEQLVIAARLKGALENFFTYGPFGLVKAAGEAALITTLFETAKRSILKFGDGGIILEPVVGMGMHSGRPYMIGERGPEAVIPLPSSASNGGASSGFLNGEVLRELRDLRRELASLRLRVRGTDLIMAVDRAARQQREARL